MSEKLLVADDSPTIQKVVGITLANTDYEIVQAQSEEELMSLLDSDDFDLVLLDFNLSEENDGYELCSLVREKKNDAKIMIMLGTFDTVADDRLEELGVVEKVIKPFESGKFINKIRDAISSDQGESESSEDFNLDQATYDLGSTDGLDDSDQSGDDEDSWTISGPSHEEPNNDNDDDNSPMPEGNFLEQVDTSNELASEVQGWGMSVPGVIDSSSSHSSDDGLLPPKMGSGTDSLGIVSETTISSENETGEWDTADLLGESDASPSFDATEQDVDQGVDVDEDEQEEILMPSSGDLDYPDLGGTEDESENEVKEGQPSSSLVSLDELAGADDEDEELEDTDPQIIIAQQDDDPNLEKALDDELEPDEFWAADDSYDITQEEEQESIKIEPSEEAIEAHSPIEVGPKMEEDESHHPAVEALNELSQREEELREIGPKLEQDGPSQENVQSTSSSSFNDFTKHELIQDLKEELRPLIKDLVKEVVEEMGRETSEKVAWEIIPDLAENLIRTEVEKLSQKVQEKHSLN